MREHGSVTYCMASSFLWSALVVTLAHGAEIQHPDLSARIDPATGVFHDLRVSVLGASLRCVEASIVIRNANGDAMTPTGVEAEQEALEQSYPFGSCRVRATCSDHSVDLHVRVANSTDAAQMVMLVFGVRLDPEGVKVFDGKKTHEDLTKLKDLKRSERETHARFPLVCAYNDGAGLALGVGAEDFHSEFIPEICPHGDGTISLRQTIRMTLFENGGTYEGRLHLIPFSPKYAERDAIARYQSLYPKRFTRRTDIDPRLHGFAAAYQSWKLDDPEMVRMTGGDWEWCISPSRRGGDITDRFYEYEPTRPLSKFRCRYRERGKWVHYPRDVDRDTWLHHQKVQLDHSRACNVANGFYVIAHSWIDDLLAKQFPNSHNSKHSPYPPWRANWGPPQDTARSIFTYKTSWGKVVRDMMQELCERDVPIAAIAFDSPSGSQKYRGPALRQIENVSWDEYGPYVAAGVGNAHLYEFVHTLKKNGYTMGVLNNSHSISHILDAFYHDSTMVEANPWRYDRPWPILNRYAYGQKSATWWEGYHIDELLQLDKLSLDDLEDAVRGLADFTALNSFRCGITYPHYFSYGVEYLLRMIPAMKAVNRAGWRPVLGFSCTDERLEPARYGRGHTTFLTIGAWCREAVEDTLTARPGELWSDVVPPTPSKQAHRPLVFADFFGHETANTVREDGVEVPVRVLGRKVKVLRCVMSLDPGARGQVTVTQTETYDRLTVQGIVEGAIASAALPRVRGHKALTKVLVDGKEAANLAVVPLKDKRTLTCIYESSRTDLTQDDIASFRFLDDELKPTFRIRCGADADSKFLAERLVEFFRYYVAFKKKLKRPWDFRLEADVRSAQTYPAHTVALLSNRSGESLPVRQTVGTGPLIWGQPRNGLLVLSGDSFGALQISVYDLMNLLNATTFRDLIGTMPHPTMRGLSLRLLPPERAVFE